MNHHTFPKLLLFASAVLGCAPSIEVPGERTFASSASLAIDDSALYWVDRALGAVVTQPRHRAAPVRLAPASPSVYAPLAVTPSDVFWVDVESGVAVHRAPLGGGPVVVAAVTDGGPIGIAVTADHLYLPRMPGVVWETTEVSLSTGEARSLEEGSSALGIALDETHLFGTSCVAGAPGGGVWRVPRGGGARAPVAPDARCPITVAVDEGHVYFYETERLGVPGSVAGVFRVPVEGGTVELVTPTAGIEFAVRGGFVYAAGKGAILRASMDGDTAVVALAGEVAGIAVGDDVVYWTERDDEGVLVLKLAELPD